MNDDAEYLPGSGDVVWLDFDPPTGHEHSGRRPALVVSERLFAERCGLAIVCPVTSRGKGLPYEIRLVTTKITGAILPIHVGSVDWRARHCKFVDVAPVETVSAAHDAVITILGIA